MSAVDGMGGVPTDAGGSVGWWMWAAMIYGLPIVVVLVREWRRRRARRGRKA